MNGYPRRARVGFLALTVLCASARAFAGDILVGKYSSLSKQEQGLGEHGKYTVNVMKTDTGYTLECFDQGRPLFTQELQRCSDSELRTRYFHTYALPGQLEALCDPNLHSVQFFYAQNGIKLPDYMAPEELVSKAQYYGNVQSAFFRFRKLDQPQKPGN